jgi:hypothetical protein
MEEFLGRWYRYARFGKIQNKGKDEKKTAFHQESMDYIEKLWKELKNEQRQMVS